MPFDTSQHFQAADPGSQSTSTREIAPGGFSVLQSMEGFTCTKTWGWTGDQWLKLSSRNAGKWFTVTEIDCRSHRDFADHLISLAADPRNMVIQGALTPEARAQGPTRFHRRKWKPDPKDPSYVPSFMPVSYRCWVTIDIDGLRLPTGYDVVRDPISAVKWAIRELLPACFQNVRALYQLSASAGFGLVNVLDAHLFFWLDRAIDDKTLRATIQQIAPLVDDRVCLATQEIYIARPGILGGADPIAQRFGWIEGSYAEVSLPIIAPEAPMPGRGRGARKGKGGGAQHRGERKFYSGLEDALAHIGDGDGLDGFNRPLWRATMFYAAGCRRGGRQRDDSGFVAMLLARIRAARRENGRDPLEYVDEPYHYGQIGNAFAWLDRQETEADPPLEALARPVADRAGVESQLKSLFKTTTETAMAWRPVRQTPKKIKRKPAQC